MPTGSHGEKGGGSSGRISLEIEEGSCVYLGGNPKPEVFLLVGNCL